MKKHGTLNSDISKVLADLGHTDKICIGDCGLPIPNGVKKIDLAVTFGTPSFYSILQELDKHLVYEKVFLAEEIQKQNNALHLSVKDLIGKTETEYVSHETFKELTKDCKVIIRTGENTPYANIILQSGVYFGTEE